MISRSPDRSRLTTCSNPAQVRRRSDLRRCESATIHDRAVPVPAIRQLHPHGIQRVPAEPCLRAHSPVRLACRRQAAGVSPWLAPPCSFGRVTVANPVGQEDAFAARRSPETNAGRRTPGLPLSLAGAPECRPDAKTARNFPDSSGGGQDQAVDLPDITEDLRRCNLPSPFAARHIWPSLIRPDTRIPAPSAHTGCQIGSATAPDRPEAGNRVSGAAATCREQS